MADPKEIPYGIPEDIDREPIPAQNWYSMARASGLESPGKPFLDFGATQGGAEITIPREYTWGQTFKDLANSVTGGLVGEQKDPKTKMFFPTAKQEYPSKEDAEFARKSEFGHGNPATAHTKEGSLGRVVDESQVVRVVNGGLYNKLPYVARTKEQGDALMQAQLAANRSAIASLGYDPRELVTTPVGKKEFSAVGATNVKAPYSMWVHEGFPSTYVHESMHRGLNKLKEAGVKIPEDDETLVRAMMWRYFGDTEKGKGALGDEQVEDGKTALRYGKYSQMIDELEAQAAQVIAKNRPRGPR